MFLKDKTKSLRVGIGMISRGEVGLIVAGVGVTSGVLSADIYTAVIIMVAATTVVSPIWLRKSYKEEITSEEKST
jgi:Kef-type K+ transport system membrane component KefB